MSWIDLAIIVIIGLSMLTGLMRGFVKELIALGIWVLAFWLAYNYSQSLSPSLQQYIPDNTARNVTAFIIILIGTLLAGAIANAILGFILKLSGLTGPDRILGAAFGFVRGVFIVALIMVVIRMTSLPYQQYAANSELYSKFDPLVNWLYSAMPNFMSKVPIFNNQPSIPSIPNLQKPFEDIKNKIQNSSMLDRNDYELSDA